MLAGVVALVTLLLIAAGTQFDNDWASVFLGIAALAGGAVLLDRFGRKRAESDPHPAYRTDGLPVVKTALKPLLVVATFAAVTAWYSATAKPGEWGSPLPFFFAAGFLLLVLPQLLARLAVRRAGDRETAPGR